MVIQLLVVIQQQQHQLHTHISNEYTLPENISTATTNPETPDKLVERIKLWRIKKRGIYLSDKVIFLLTKNKITVKITFSKRQQLTVTPLKMTICFFFWGGGEGKLQKATPAKCQNQFLGFLKKR